MTSEDLLQRIEHLQKEHTGPVIIGVVGAPGAGKTTLVEQLMKRLMAEQEISAQQHYAHVPMDGYHLADVELSRLGRLDRKGAPDTFDAHGYASLLRRLREPRNAVVHAPGFERTIEQPIAGAIPVYPSASTILTEGNYLLLDEPGWREVRKQCTEIWYCEQDDELRVERLIARHIRFGKSPLAAAKWVAEVDEPNGRLIGTTRDRADLVITLEEVAAG
ncbi:nucleoside/nucleotide kinase family protein [Arthrobacter agilis]|uniref:nucleoside/nucleotide kinase family protein n=1 Tax=Arthrobacter agilis TaxID=37921 RepID=UPI000B35C484|nr:nucleoside/nucleotide kinase family protein [Arthrobacter agilis]OUM41408.1 nucleoside/nucleotide kinase family protein [Arthrobacter agilis]PPB46260.1 nucleoside/nucleotide kinase family protein [Arthrobacter agilis]TPV27017.1 nucleoside/nucleotide kinase family protein [Arthrobacter agilis]VDR32838.1 nucleoside triphosphate hydrolase domain-containing protein [Arthrobacter agilis]